MILSQWRKFGYTTKPVKRMSLQDLKQETSLQGQQANALDVGRTRLIFVGALMAIAFGGIGFRMVDVMALRHTETQNKIHVTQKISTTVQNRAQIIDRNGLSVATTVKTVSLAADPKKVLDIREAAQKLSNIFEDIPVKTLIKKLMKDTRFVWLKREVTPTQQQEIIELGIPGLHFRDRETRLYPQGNLLAHVMGYTNIDNQGISGIEKSFDQYLTQEEKPLRLSIDSRIQHIVRKEVNAAIQEFSAIGGSAIVMDANNGQVISMVSLPDFDPNNPAEAPTEAAFNRATLGVYELGSTFKIFNSAMALESGVANMKSSFDASKPLKVARFTIRDYHAKNRWLSLPEIFIYSSNIGSAKMAEAMGADFQKSFLKEMGMLKATTVELPEVGRPQYPKNWRPINAMTISYGHGIAVSPMHVVSGVATMVNGGVLYEPTLLTGNDTPEGKRIISKRSSDQVRKLMRANNTLGSGKKSEAVGYFVGGKTGTAEKVKSGARGYDRNLLISSYVAAFPMNDPKYVVYVMLDEPKGTKKTYGYATGGWVAAPSVGRIINRAAPLLGVMPQHMKALEIDRELALDLPTDGHT